MTNYHPGMTKKRGGCLTAILTGLALLLGLTVAATPAEATGYFFTCPQALQSQAFTCTYVKANSNGVNVLDRTTGTVINWKNLTKVGMGWWTTDTGNQCGIGPDHVVWAVKWLGAYNIIHWAVLGGAYLWNGTINDWGPKSSDGTGVDFYNPDRRAFSTGSGPCNGSGWNRLGNGQ